MLLDEPPREPQLVTRQALDLECARRQVIDEGQLDLDAEPIEDQVVRLGDGEFRRYERLGFLEKNAGDSRVAGLVRIGLGVKRSGIHDEGHQRLPIKRSYSSLLSHGS